MAEVVLASHRQAPGVFHRISAPYQNNISRRFRKVNTNIPLGGNYLMMTPLPTTTEREAHMRPSITTALTGVATVAVMLTASPAALAVEEGCQGFGPQTPRDIDQLAGTNPRSFSLAPPSSELNLCNIHFHQNAEHKAAAFSIATKGDKDGVGGGFQCGLTTSLSDAELKPVKEEVCGGIEPGDTIEVHWVFSSCAVAPGPGLGSCLASNCANPDLRVETQVFTVVNDNDAIDFEDLDYAGSAQDGLHQPKAIPSNTGAPVQFAGSTTGPSFSESTCSPLQVSWSVRPQCAKVDINSLARWCEDNAFDENKAHGVRELVTNPALLSKIH